MPIYEYECGDCQHTWEHFARRVSEPAPASCPACGESQVRKLVSKKTGFQLKGQGWAGSGYAKPVTSSKEG